jgi:hypothetical protein
MRSLVEWTGHLNGQCISLSSDLICSQRGVITAAERPAPAKRVDKAAVEPAAVCFDTNDAISI